MITLPTRRRIAINTSQMALVVAFYYFAGNALTGTGGSVIAGILAVLSLMGVLWLATKR